MSARAEKIFTWLPRVLALAFAAFISLFALDVFAEGYSFWETVWALLMHLVPTALVLVALVIAWRWTRLGAILFFSLAGLYLVMAVEQLPWAMIIAGPLVLVGLLFLLSRWTGGGQVHA